MPVWVVRSPDDMSRHRRYPIDAERTDRPTSAAVAFAMAGWLFGALVIAEVTVEAVGLASGSAWAVWLAVIALPLGGLALASTWRRHRDDAADEDTPAPPRSTRQPAVPADD